MHLVIQWLVNHRAVAKGNLPILDFGSRDPSDCVLHPIDIVAIWVILVCLSTAGFMAVLSTPHLLACLVEQILEFKSLNEICVPHHGAISHTNILELPHGLDDFFLTCGQVLGVSVHWCVRLHQDLKLAPQHCSWDRTRSMPQLVQAFDGPLASVCRNWHWRTVWLHKFGSGICCLPTEHN